MKLSAKLAFKHLKNNPKRTAWTLFSIVLAVGMLTAIGGFGASGATALDALVSEIDGMEAGAGIISFSLAAILGLTVAFTAAVVISNTFRVSAYERTKQFGILKSVGATGKQIRQNILYEGLFLLVIGLPLGILAGFLMQILALAVINSMVDISAISNTIRFRFEIEPTVLSIAVILSVAVVMFSAWLPARKAAKTPAIMAIKGLGEIKTNREKPKKHLLTPRQSFALQNFATLLRKGVTPPSQTNIDPPIEVCQANSNHPPKRGDCDTNIAERFNWCRNNLIGGVIIIGKIFGFEGVLASKQLKRSRRHFRATVISIVTSIVLIIASVSLSTHMSRSFEGRMLQMGSPTAGFALLAADGVVGMDMETLTQINRELRTFPDTTVATIGGSFYTTAQNEFVWVFVPDRDEYLELVALAGVPDGSNLLINVHLEIDARGNPVQFNPHNKQAGESLRLYPQAETENVYLTIDGIINELPAQFLYLSESIIIIVVPERDVYFLQWAANTLDPTGFNAFAEETINANYNLRAGEELMQLDFAQAFAVLGIMVDSALAYVQIFSIMLIFLGLTNVISTIAASVKLRSREFAVFTSVGMDKKGLRKMLALESLLSSVKALLFGMPLGFGMAYLMYIVGEVSNPVGIVFTPPWAAMAVCAAGVVAVTFVIMQISASAVKQNNLMGVN